MGMVQADQGHLNSSSVITCYRLVLPHLANVVSGGTLIGVLMGNFSSILNSGDMVNASFFMPESIILGGYGAAITILWPKGRCQHTEDKCLEMKRDPL